MPLANRGFRCALNRDETCARPQSYHPVDNPRVVAFARQVIASPWAGGIARSLNWALPFVALMAFGIVVFWAPETAFGAEDTVSPQL